MAIVNYPSNSGKHSASESNICAGYDDPDVFTMLRDFQMHLLKNMDHVSGSNSEYENHGYIFRPARNTYYIELYRGQVGI